MSKSEQLVLKHKELLKVSKQCPSMREIDFINSCLSGNQIYKKSIPKETFLRYDLDNYAKNRNFSIKEAYKVVLDILEDIFSTTGKVAIDLSSRQVWYTNLLSGYKVEESTYSIWIQWNAAAIYMVSGLMPPGSFTYIDKRMGALGSKKKYLMCELLQRNLYKGEFYLLVNDIYLECCVGDDEYKDFSDFQKRILKPTIEAIKATMGVEIKHKKSFNKVNFKVVGGMKEAKKVQVDKEQYEKLQKENKQYKIYGNVLEE
jgi:hypothetical protein